MGALLALGAGWIWRRGRKAQRRARQQLACLDFLEGRSSLGEVFLAAANKTGMPRGLRWIRCDLGEELRFAEDRANGELYAVISATIGFEAIPGGGMEEVEAVGNLRYATVFFVHRQGSWHSDGLSAFSFNPDQSLERYEESLSPLEFDLPSPSPAQA